MENNAALPKFRNAIECLEFKRNRARMNQPKFSNAKECLEFKRNRARMELPRFKSAKELLGFKRRKARKNHNQLLNHLLGELEPISFRERARLGEFESLTVKHYTVITIEEILKTAKENKWSLCINRGQVYLYNGAFWKQMSKEELLDFLGQASEKLGVPQYNARYYRFKTDLLRQFISTAYLPRPTREGNEVLVNLPDGTFVISQEQQKLREFRMEDFLTYQLAFSYDPLSNSPIFQTYLDRVLPDRNQQLILAEFIGYIFTTGLKLEKVLILYGSGANGKSVFFDVIKALLGSNNISSYSLQALTNNLGYSRADLPNKLVNYGSEISPEMDTTVFKLLISGEPVEARLPYGNPFIIDNYAKFIFNTNELPKDVEDNEAFFRRFLIINFGVTIPEKDRDVQLAQKIIASELPGVFNWVLEGLQRLLKQKGFTQSEESERALINYRVESDSVQLFLLEEGFVPDKQNQILLKDMSSQYKRFCTESGERSISNKLFSSKLRGLGFIISRKTQGNFVDAKRKSF
jgi:putative DNA primase/helicase